MEMEKKAKKRLREEQVRLLEFHYSLNKKLEGERKSQLAAELGVPPRQVAIWYQNKRAREKIQGLEMDHKRMQMRLQSVVADNARLKEELNTLKLELNKIHAGHTDFYASIVHAHHPWTST